MVQQLIEELQELQKQKKKKKPTINEFFKEQFGAIPGDNVYLIIRDKSGTYSKVIRTLAEVKVILQRNEVFEEYGIRLGANIVVHYQSYIPGQYIAFEEVDE